MARNLAIYGTFAATERVLIASVKAGADRQEMHELIRGQSMVAWEAVGGGKPNPLTEILAADSRLREFLSGDQIGELMDYTQHLGNVPSKASEMAERIRAEARDLRSATHTWVAWHFFGAVIVAQVQTVALTLSNNLRDVSLKDAP